MMDNQPSSVKKKSKFTVVESTSEVSKKSERFHKFTHLYLNDKLLYNIVSTENIIILQKNCFVF